MEEKPLNYKRTEEVDHIVNRMPQKFGIQITLIALGILGLLLLLGFCIAYPDVQQGNVTINTEAPAIKLYATSSGKIILLKKNMQMVGMGDVLGYIDNPANMNDVFRIDSLLQEFDISKLSLRATISEFPRKVYLGAINAKYYAFLDALMQYQNYYENRIYDKQIKTYQRLLNEQDHLLQKVKDKQAVSGENLALIGRSAKRDSILLAKKVISIAEFERNKMGQMNAVFSDVNAKNEASQIMLEIFRTQNAVNESFIKKDEVEKTLYLSLSSYFQELIASIKQFDELFVFRSPQAGNIQYLNFWNNNLFVKAGEPVFSVIPSNSKIIAQVLLPNVGAGKVQERQKVIIKLDDYPYNEFGALEGDVRDISMVANTQMTEKGNIESYLINVQLQKGLTTNYGVILQFKHELKGTAEIITKERLLIERVFETVKYMLRDRPA
ncbi:HlyD family efflux transporter periplasmic adaptor subunit [Sphingobacterium griseoflavum]|uniref:Hemolysin D n=1 Tax=Sphingobacterium griseoflavum TaxID=1474952 RepID=A0ABQ3HW14_9SPHI|nr:HlyD family efflux transporter periplasmic adaptor subunit [Sphingobacterium griseoflavum]GHE29014.1 hemolysin D [Sphingobacterium griseoflavum]